MIDQIPDSRSQRIVSFGEVLWDILPDGEYPGGAPANFAIHCRALGAESVLVSRVGRDARGERMRGHLARAGLVVDFVEVDESLPTGVVTVTVERGEPRYDIGRPAAWDAIEASPESIAAIRRADAVCFGTLAQRDARSRAALEALLPHVRSGAIRILDINLRPPFVSREVLLSSLEMANSIKLNEDELDVLGDWLGLTASPREALAGLAERFQLRLVALTRGDRGSLVLHEGQLHEHPGYKVDCRDAIGAGDSFTAALIMSVLAGWDLGRASQFANEVAAFVASCSGATPKLPAGLVSQILPNEPQP